MIILGAGLSGLLAGALDRRAEIFEAQSLIPHNHWAVLRFREDKIGRALNIPFRPVKVLKAIAFRGELTTSVTPETANLYSKKAIGGIASRSILDLRPADRFVAPGDLIARLAEMCAGRVHLGETIDGSKLKRLRTQGTGPLISTIPLPAMLTMLGIEHELTFARAPIRVYRYRVRSADAFQTVYFPDPLQPAYRATLTGDELIVELVEKGVFTSANHREVFGAFGLKHGDVELLNTHRQSLGKIVPLPDNARKALLLRLSRDHGVFSLGRFACWRNILLDDVHNDFFRVREMASLGEYDLTRSTVENKGAR